MSQSDIGDLEKELEGTDLKTLLADIAASNRGIYQQLALLNQQLDGETESETQMFECTRCHETVSEEKRKQHMIQSHNAPSDLGDDLLHNFKSV